jgi:multiple sugar transport system permease protein
MTGAAARTRSTERFWVILFISPWVISFLAFFAYPLFLALSTSFVKVSLLEQEKARFVGLENVAAVVGDRLFWQSLFNVAYNQAIFITVSLAVALVLAVMIFELRVGGGFFRTVYFLPIITSATVAMIIFDNLTGPTGPIQSFLLQTTAMKAPLFWKFTQWLPMPILAVYNSWKWYGIQMIIILGGLASIDKSLYEAAMTDGAGWWRRLLRITLPILKPQIVFIVTVNVIYGLQMFTEVFLLFDVNGGILGAGLTPVLYLYKVGFRDMQMGYASSLGLVLAAIIFAVTSVQLALTNRD